jgi:hypothetical protein
MLGKPNCGILELLKGTKTATRLSILMLPELTGSAPTPVDGSLAGLSHVWDLETDYYEVDLPIWVDEVSDMSAWEKDFLRPEAQEVTAAVGAWIYCFRRPVTDEDLVRCAILYRNQYSLTILEISTSGLGRYYGCPRERR